MSGILEFSPIYKGKARELYSTGYDVSVRLVNLPEKYEYADGIFWLQPNDESMESSLAELLRKTGGEFDTYGVYEAI